MQVELTPKTEALIHSLLPEGGDPSSLIEAAVAELVEYGSGEVPACVDPATGEPLSIDQLRAEIAKGDAAIAAGDVAPLDVEEIKRAARERSGLAADS